MISQLIKLEVDENDKCTVCSYEITPWGRLQEQTFHYNPGGINGPLTARIRGVYGRMTVPAGAVIYRDGPVSLRKRVDGAVLRWKRQLMERLHRPEIHA